MNLTNLQANFKYLIIAVLILLLLIIFGVGFFIQNSGKTPSNNNSNTGTESEPENQKHVAAPVPSLFPVRVEPTHGQTGVSTSPKIIIYFKDTVKGKNINVKVEPSFEFNGTFDESGKILTLLTTTTLKTNTKYKISLVDNNKTIYYWEFITSAKALVSGEVTALNTLKNKLPYYGDHFWIDYKSLTDQFFVYIDAQPADSYKQKALAYFVSNGISKPETTLNISFVPVGAAAPP